MIIPIQNIYYLLCYAWDKLEEGDYVDVKKIDSTELVDLFAKVLLNGVTRLLRRGIDRDYLEYNDTLNTIKGKVDFVVSGRRNLFANAQVYCHFDEMSHNILQNQIIKVTLLSLINNEKLNSDLKDELVHIFRFFAQLDTVVLTPKAFRSVQLHRNNHFYNFLLQICELIYEFSLIDESTGKTRFKDFIRDEKKMAYLFEEFVRNFYKRELIDAKVYREDIYWEGKKQTLLPKMQTDISIDTGHKKIIIDTKYYKEALSTNYDREAIRSNNLYQIYAYLKQAEYKNEYETEPEGILLYPVAAKETSETFEIEGHKIRIETINLNQDWRDIHRDLIGLVSH